MMMVAAVMVYICASYIRRVVLKSATSCIDIVVAVLATIIISILLFICFLLLCWSRLRPIILLDDSGCICK